MDKPIFDFEKKLAYSQGFRLKNDIETLKKLIDGCVSVVKTNLSKDKNGIDYIAMLRGKAEINIDAKTREPGCSQFWQNGEPELAPEIWSVMPSGKYNIPREQAKTGWTLDESKNSHYIFCTFDPADTDKVYLLPFQLYRMAFRRNLIIWREVYKQAIQDSGSWQSMCLFIPAFIVLNAINIEMEAYKKLLGQQEFDF